MSAQARKPFDDEFSQGFRELSVTHDRDRGVLWYFMQPQPRPCFTPRLLAEIRNLQQRVGDHLVRSEYEQDVRYLVLGSAQPGVFNLGGDLRMFVHWIESRDRAALVRYATACIDVLHPNAVDLDLPLTTVSLVQGSALGGGFEAALSSSVVIAERGAQMGLPEILFNLFPGMGAYSFLSRRISPGLAERMILSGRTYTGAELYDMGVVDVLAEDGCGEDAVDAWVRRQNRAHIGIAAVHEIRRRIHPVTREELMDVAMLWVDSALQLTTRDLRMMQRLVKAQNQLDRATAAAASVAPVALSRPALTM